MIHLSIFAVGLLACVGAAHAVDFDPQGKCVFHVHAGEILNVPRGFMWVDGSMLRGDQTLWCYDEGSLGSVGAFSSSQLGSK